MHKWMTRDEMVRHAFTGEKPPPRVYVRNADGTETDIGYACKFDEASETIELPGNLPGGSEVWVDGKYLIATPVELVHKAAHVSKSQRPLPRNLLAACIGHALYGSR